MSRQFTMQRGKVSVTFGAGAAERLQELVAPLGVQRVLVTCTPRRAAEASAVGARLGARLVGVAAIAREHVPLDVVAEAQREAERKEADALLAFGGGSAIGLAKAVALALRAQVIAVPTTYSGSEMTPVYGVTEAGGREKKTGRDERARPSLEGYDPRLTIDLPREVTIASLWNAMAHAVEALWAPSADRATLLAAEEALRLVAGALIALDARLDDADARDHALEGACLAGLVFGDAGGGLHHKICHVLGGMFAMPHAATHAALLPAVVRFQREAAPDAMRARSRARSASSIRSWGSSASRARRACPWAWALSACRVTASTAWWTPSWPRRRSRRSTAHDCTRSSRTPGPRLRPPRRRLRCAAPRSSRCSRASDRRTSPRPWKAPCLGGRTRPGAHPSASTPSS